MSRTSGEFIRNSISTKLLKAVFLLYVVIAVMVTVIHMTVEYYSVKEDVYGELKKLRATFEPMLANALWNVNTDLLEPVAAGIMKIPSIVGIRIEDEKGITLVQNGLVDYPDKQFSALISYRFQVRYLEKDIPRNAGAVTFFSSSVFVFQRVKLGFLFIIVNGLIKTIALWWIFLWMSRKLLSRPLEKLTSAVEKIDFDHLEKIHVKNDSTQRDELTLLAEAFNGMIHKLNTSLAERDQAREDLQKSEKFMEERLRHVHKMEALGRLAGGVAHDFNNILTPILGYCEIMKHQLHHERHIGRSVEHIYDAGLRARDLVRQLLAFGRKQELEVKVINLNSVLKEFKKLLLGMIREDIEIHFQLSERLPNIKADIGQIEQVVMNLVINARDAMPEGGRILIKTGEIVLDETNASEYPEMNPGRFALLFVEDTGIGMDVDTLERIFDPFFTTKEKGKGTGLGLATVYGIIKQHNGHIFVKSGPGAGTTVRIYFPETDNENGEKVEIVRKPETSGKTETIMVVEDNQSVREITRTILKTNGYNVLTAESGRDCLQQLQGISDTPHLLLTDVIMPDMNGKKLYEIVSRLYPGIAVLYMSGYMNDLIAQHGVLDEGIAFIQKPFSAESLMEIVQETLKKRSSKG